MVEAPNRKSPANTLLKHFRAPKGCESAYRSRCSPLQITLDEVGHGLSRAVMHAGLRVGSRILNTEKSSK